MLDAVLMITLEVYILASHPHLKIPGLITCVMALALECHATQVVVLKYQILPKMGVHSDWRALYICFSFHVNYFF